MLTDPVKRKLGSAVREASRQIPHPWPGAFFLTDPNRTPDPWDVIRSLPSGTGVIYRHFESDDRFETGIKLRSSCFKRGIPLLISNDPQLAIALRADGVHWPEAQAYKARHWQGRFLYQTQSVHSASGMRRAVCEAVLYSTVFPSNSPTASKPLGAVRFRRLAYASDKLVYALGGVNGLNAAQVSGKSGLSGIEGFL